MLGRPKHLALIMFYYELSTETIAKRSTMHFVIISSSLNLNQGIFYINTGLIMPLARVNKLFSLNP
jgi:hypothetical protein